MSTEAEIGTLIVVILKARNLIDKHSLYKQDAFAQASLNGVTKKTHVDVRGGQHPVWDAELRFPIMKAASDKTRKLEVSCFAKERRSDDLLGKGIVDISETLKTGEFDDWVSLDIDGVVRGDVYLEMTYFASGPPPAAPNSSVASSLAVPPSQALTRRPSKLPPSERLYRPSQTHLPQSTPNASGRPPSSASAGRPAPPASNPPLKGKGSELPPLPEHQSGQATLPGILLPAGGTRPKPQRNSPSPGPLPSILRPGNGNVSVPTPWPPDRAHRLSASPPPSNPRVPAQPSPSYGSSPYTGSSNPNPYLSEPTPPPPIVPAIPSNNPQPAPLTTPLPYGSSISSSPAPPTWDQYGAGASVTNFSFPMPMVSATPQPNPVRVDPYQSYGPHQTIRDELPSSRWDPYLEARYQNPLPLPSRTEPKPLLNLSRDRQPELKPDTDRVEALKRAEEEAARRREQEQRDLELALQLDRELNT